MTLTNFKKGIGLAALGAALLGASTFNTSDSSITATRNGRTGDYENLQQYIAVQGERYNINFKIEIRSSLTRTQANNLALNLGSRDVLIALSNDGRRGYVYIGTELTTLLPLGYASTLETNVVNPNMSRRDWYNAIIETADRIIDKAFFGV